MRYDNLVFPLTDNGESENGHLRNRFLLAVICCPIYHWLEVSHEVDISRANRKAKFEKYIISLGAINL